MKTPIQAAQDLLHVMTEVGQAECYLSDMKLVIEGLQQAHREGWEQCKMECIQECADAADDNLTAGMVKHAIASMEYKGGEAND